MVLGRALQVNTCIDISRKSDDLDERLEILLSFITMFVYRNVCRGLFEQHKMIFSFLICTSILRASGAIPMVRFPRPRKLRSISRIMRWSPNDVC